MNIQPTQAALFMSELVQKITNTRAFVICQGPHGSGKSSALEWAVRPTATRKGNSQYLVIDGTRGGDELKLVRSIAAALKIQCKSSTAAEIMYRIRSQMCKRHVGLVAVDNIDCLSAPFQRLILQLLNVSLTSPEHQIGFLGLQTAGGFDDVAREYGYQPALLNLPQLTRNEVASFLRLLYPSVQLVHQDPRQRPKLEKLVDALLAISGARPLSLFTFLEGLRLGSEIPPTPALKDCLRVLQLEHRNDGTVGEVLEMVSDKHQQ